MDTFIFFAAAALCAVWMAVHLFVGGPQVAGPLRAERGLSEVARETAYLCWHFVSVTLGVMALFFLLAAFGNAGMALAGTLLSGGFLGVGVLLPLLIRKSYGLLPQGWLFLPVVALGTWGMSL